MRVFAIHVVLSNPHRLQEGWITHLGCRAWLGFGIQILIEVGTGTSLTTICVPTIFEQVGFGVYKAGWLSGLNATTVVIGTMTAVVTCDRFGRRPMLMTGAFAMITCMWIFDGVSKAAIDHQNIKPSSVQWLPPWS